MAKDVTITLEDRPGTLADLSEALGEAGINVEGIAGFPVGGKGIIHILVDDADAASRVLAGRGIAVTTTEDVLVLDTPDKPGALGEVARRIADAGVNINLVYVANGSRLVVGVDDLAKAQAAV